MTLFTNLQDVSVGGVKLNPISVLKLTNGNAVLQGVVMEAKTNRFTLITPDGGVI
jgi:hypothetical protein